MFGDILNGEMELNDAGIMVEQTWNEIPEHYPGVDVDTFIVMPNHVHGIVVLSPDVSERSPRSLGTRGARHIGQARGPAPTLSFPDIVQRFKSLTTARYMHGVKRAEWERFSGRLWQRNYYEHVIRNEEELGRTREYIVYNPAKWQDDPENPSNRSDL